MYNSYLDTFICVADCGSFNKAAEQLFISPTAVMKQINALEKQLDLILLNRTAKGITLTKAGESIYKDAKYMIAYSEQAIKKAGKLAQTERKTLRVGTSMLNPCKVFMDLWYQVSDQFSQFKIQVIPFEDDHDGILSVISQIGQTFDFIVGVCDSSQWLYLCNFYRLGEFRKMIAVPHSHRLAKKKRLKITDLYGETLMMVKRGDSEINDLLRDDLERNHPQIHIEDTPHFYDINVFNRCEETNQLLLNLECWRDIHPSLVSISVDWNYTIPYGLLYPKKPSNTILEFLDALSSFDLSQD
ncbi:LysR family transcriptional regulator [Diplocloster agilis]|uniref:LysR family transcriptional regulator n=1 Tax=Diplocloster agilis TaxID=2850323 RepID=UPI000820870A|nr:LysR family transcriptional regulator [Suonthocola fibrivorans]MCU6734695.1 LysR family transcriptional regulator [Suonthocola fibrivorans]SCJ50328.1 CysJI operon transcriptional activator [uncultured Clostridium sp.]